MGLDLFIYDKTFERVRVFLHPSDQDQWYHTLYRFSRDLGGLPVEKELSSDAIMADLRPGLPQKPGIRFRTSWLGSMQEDKGSVSILLLGDDTGKLEQLKNITFMNKEGKPIPLSSLARFTIEKGFGEISRVDGKTFLEVKAKTPKADLARISGRIDEIMQDFQLPYGYSWRKGSQFSRLQE